MFYNDKIKVFCEKEMEKKQMSKKILILSGSPRKDGNSDLLCDEFMRGASESGNDVEKIRVAAKKLQPVPAVIIAGIMPANVRIRMIWQRSYRK